MNIKNINTWIEFKILMEIPFSLFCMKRLRYENWQIGTTSCYTSIVSITSVWATALVIIWISVLLLK